jgi:hypothetical protein
VWTNKRSNSKEIAMRQAVVVVALLAMVVAGSSAQFKSQVQQETQGTIGRLGDSSPFSGLFGWFHPDKFSMRHSFDLSYTSFAGQGFSLGTYTNSMRYEIAENLNARADVSLSFSPFSSLSTFNKKDFSGVYLSRAEINYKPWDNVFMQVQYRQIPYSVYYSPFSFNPFYREPGF